MDYLCKKEHSLKRNNLMDRFEQNTVILGGGLTGLSAGLILKDKATILERNNRPGGLVQTVNFNGYWFDHVIHLLHFRDDITEATIKELLKTDLHPIAPLAYVETTEGIGKYPLQMNLNGLSKEAISKTLTDLAKVSFNIKHDSAENFEDMLRKSFGDYFCNLFMFPYNNKVWKRPLNSLAPSGFQWNIDQPNFEQVLNGAISDNSEFESYNANAWYPRPKDDTKVKGMEFLSYKLAQEVSDLRLNHEVKAVYLGNKTVIAQHQDTELEITYTNKCLSTIPLPQLINICEDIDPKYKQAKDLLKYNRVLSIMVSIEGPRPENTGHWRYYGQSDICFTRLVFMHTFDPNLAPSNGWGLLVEMIEPSEWPLRDKDTIIDEVLNDILKVKAIPNDCKVIGKELMVVDPAYVVFTKESKALVEDLKVYFDKHGLKLLGRYGQWEYSSMAQVMRDGFQWAKSIK